MIKIRYLLLPLTSFYMLLSFLSKMIQVCRDHLDSNIRGTNTSLNSNFLTRVIVTYLRKTLQHGVGYEVLTSEYGRFNELYKFVYLCQEFNCHLQVCAEPILSFHMTFKEEDRKFHPVQEPGCVLPCEPWNQSYGDIIATTSVQDVPLHNSRRLSHGINPLETKHRPLYLKAQSVPCCKHLSPRL